MTETAIVAFWRVAQGFAVQVSDTTMLNGYSYAGQQIILI